MAYRKVYFRIKSGYAYGDGWLKDTDALAFKEETRRLFQEAGWTLHAEKLNSSSSDTVTRNQQNLYLHPMNFSGVIDEDEVPMIEALLAGAVTFQCYHTDLYDVYEDWSDEVYLEYLESRRDEIADALLEHYRTKRRNLYFVGKSSMRIADYFSVHRLCDKENRHNKAYTFVEGLVEQLIAEGKLITAQAKNGIGIRTAMKADKKQPSMS